LTLAPALPEARAASRPNDYIELKRRIRAARLLDTQPAYYTRKVAITLAVYAGVLAVPFFVHSWITLLFAAAAGVMTTQVGLIGHDLQHRQIVRNRRLVVVLGIIVGDLLVAISYSWWSAKHNAHHGQPNVMGGDPDIDFPMLAFDERQVADKPRIWRPVLAHQAPLFFVLAAFQALNMHLRAIQHVLADRPRHRVWEGLALAGHVAFYAVLLVQLGWPLALGFFVISQAVSGVYNGMVFAPNHKGMPVFTAADDLDFLRGQVLTSRNVRGHPLTDLFYGGLNYQIEHHLFPTMPRNNLHRAQPIVRAFCAEVGLPYAETGPAGSMRAILGHLHAVSAPLRA
jgi:fatty acid desaturase